MPGDPFYHSKAWHRVRTKALMRDKYKCVNCGVSIRGKGQARVDHIKPKRDFPALALHLPNVRSICVACDNARSVHQRNRRAAEPPEIGADGFPVGSDWGKM